MNVEITVKGITIKVQSTDRKHVDNLILAAIHFENGGKFEDVYEVKKKAEQKVISDEPKKPKNFTPEINGVKDYGNGKVTYKCGYTCMCNHTGVRYIEGHEEFVHCHRCNEKMNVMAASPNELHDKDFYYFLAY